MPYRYVIDVERRLVINTASDPITFAETKEDQDRLAADPDFNPEFDQLIDATAVTRLDMSIDQARTIARQSMFSSMSRRAVIASNPVVFGMARVMETYHSIANLGARVSVFRDRESALKWLGAERHDG